MVFMYFSPLLCQEVDITGEGNVTVQATWHEVVTNELSHLTPTKTHDIRNTAEGIHVRLSEEGDRYAMTTSTPGSPDTVDVRYRTLWEVVVDDHVYTLASKHIREHQAPRVRH